MASAGKKFCEILLIRKCKTRLCCMIDHLGTILIKLLKLAIIILPKVQCD